MTKEAEQFETDEAQKALDSIHLFQRNGLIRGIPPLWFGFTMAALGGASIIIAGLNISAPLSLSLSLFMLWLFWRQTRKTQVIVEPLLSKRGLILLAIGSIVYCLPLILIAQAHLDTYGAALAWFGGISFTIVCSIAAIHERRKYLARLDVE